MKRLLLAVCTAIFPLTSILSSNTAWSVPAPSPSPSADECAAAGQPGGQKKCRIYTGKNMQGAQVTNQLQCCYSTERCDPNPLFANRCYGPGTTCPIPATLPNGVLAGLGCPTGTTCWQAGSGAALKSFCVPAGAVACGLSPDGKLLRTCNAAGRCSKLMGDCVNKNSTEDASKIYFQGKTYVKFTDGSWRCIAGCPVPQQPVPPQPPWQNPASMIPMI